MPIAKFAAKELGYVLREHADLLEVWEVAALTNSHERTVRRWLSSGRLKGLQKSSRGFLIPKKCLVEFLTGSQAPSEAAA